MRNCVHLLVIIVLMSCSNEIDIHFGDSSIPVCYCVLDLNSTEQYLRLGSTFIDRNDYGKTELNGLEKLDSWEDILIYVEEYNDSKPKSKYYFEPFLGIVKDSGYFEQNDLNVFISSFKAKPETLYKLYVWFQERELMVYGETITVGYPKVYDPSPIPGRTLVFDTENDYRAFFQLGNEASVCKDGFIIKLADYELEYSKSNRVSYVDNEQIIEMFSGKNFVDNIVSNLPNASDFINLNIDYYLYCCGPEMAFAISSTSVGSYNNLSDYTNITNGVGIFTSICETRINNLQLHKITIDNIKSGINHYSKDNLGKIDFIFPEKMIKSVPKDRVHCIDLSIAKSYGDLYRKQFYKSTNTSDLKRVYSFDLPEGTYVYQAGITCSAKGDTCLWGDFPGGRFGSIWIAEHFEVIRDSTSVINVHFY